jgi:hypothetical protein
MSILKKQIKPAQPSDAALRAQQIHRIANNSTKNMLTDVKNGLNTIWSAPDPAAVLLELGVDAEEVFALNSATITFLVSTLTGSDYKVELDEILALVVDIPPFTKVGDGTVTID